MGVMVQIRLFHSRPGLRSISLSLALTAVQLPSTQISRLYL